MASTYARTSSSASGRALYQRRWPSRRSLINPAASRIRTCWDTAWRVTSNCSAISPAVRSFSATSESTARLRGSARAWKRSGAIRSASIHLRKSLLARSPICSVGAVSLKERLGPFGVWMSIPAARPLDELLAVGRAVEEIGYGAFWYAETPATREALVQASLLLAATDQIVIATGITSVYSRDAIALDAGATALEEAFPGRFVLGIGVSHAPSVQSRGHDYG